VVAALIHDAVEDQGISGQTIAAMFGGNVAGLVLEVTDKKSLPQEVRKRLQVDQAPKKS
jgi:(p)ppGpp synthase/HD superfamily hydrolase